MWGSGRLVIACFAKKTKATPDVSHFQFSVIGSETFEYGEYKALSPTKSDEDDEDDEEDEDDEDDEEEPRFSDEREIIEVTSGEVTYQMDVAKGIISGGNFVHEFSEQMEW